MKWVKSVLFVVLLFFAIAAFAEDWAKVAAETAEPGFAMRIEQIVPGSQAEQFGLKEGDYFYQIGDHATQGLRGLRGLRREADEMLFYCRAGGAKGTAVLKSGTFGIGFVETFRPQLEYLRGEIGSPDPRWDGATAEALAMLERDPKAAEKEWNKVAALAYPEDELDAFVRAYCAWRLGRTVPVRDAFEKVHAEFSTMPHLYAAFLEDMAHASGQTDLLRKLRDQDPASSNLTAEQVKGWESFDSSPTPLDRLLEAAEKRRGRNLVPELKACEGEDHEKWAERLDRLKALDTFHSDPGRYTFTKFKLPDDVRDFHYSISLYAYQYGFDDKNASGVRIGAFASKEEAKPLGAGPLGEIGVYGNRFAGTLVAGRGGYGNTVREYRRFDKPNP